MTFSELHKIIIADFPEISQEQLSQFEAMEALYKDWNSKINVISRKDIDSFYEHHVLHSLAIAAYLRYNLPSEYDLLSAGKSNQPSVHQDQKAELGAKQETLSVLDLGTGGGLPGIPLAILFPHAHFTLCDSIGKMNAFATESTRSLAGEVGVFLRNVRKSVRRQERGGNQSANRDGGVVNSREMDPVAALEKQVKLLRKQKEYWKSQTKRTDGKKADSKAVRKLVLQPISNKKREPKKRSPQFWSEWRDSNPRPHGPEPCAIPNFATPR